MNLKRIGFFVLIVVVMNGSGCIRRQRQMLATPSSAQAEQITAPVNLNTATASELEQLPGVGPVLAENIIQHRNKYGPFARPEHLLLVKGISNRLFKQLSDKISVSTSSRSAP